MNLNYENQIRTRKNSCLRSLAKSLVLLTVASENIFYICHVVVFYIAIIDPPSKVAPSHLIELHSAATFKELVKIIKVSQNDHLPVDQVALTHYRFA